VGSHLSVSLSPRRALLSAPFSHLAATRHGVVLHAHVRVKSRLRPPSRVRSALSLSDAALASPRLARLPRHPGPRPHPPHRRSNRRVQAPRRFHGSKPHTTAVRNSRRCRPAMLCLRQSLSSSPTSSSAPPSSTPVRPLPCPLPLRRSATPSSCQRSGAAAARARSRRGHARATQAGAKLGQAVGRAHTT
jgi:hypothetical protein